MKILFVFLILISCSKKEQPKKESVEIAQEAYDKGIKQVISRDFSGSIISFENAEKENPYSDISKKSAILSIFANYAQAEYVAVPPLVDVYEKLYPRDPNVPYALYMKTLSIFRQIKSHKKNRTMIAELEESADYIETNFPETDFADKVRPIKQYSIDLQILNNLEIALFYERNGNYIAAANRFLDIMHDTRVSENIINIATDGLSRCKKNIGINL